MSDIKTKLAEEIATIEWNDLIPHAQRDALIVVHQSLNLLDVGIALANDNTVDVQSWISQGLIHKPSSSQLNDWNINQTQQFNTLIVQPFVLIKIDQSLS